MIREHLFKGKTIKEGEWIEGNLIVDPKGFCYILRPNKIFDFDPIILVDKDTVCEYTGLTDKNKTKIFENDIVKTDEFWCEIGVVKYGEGTFDSGIYRYTGFYYEDRDGYKDHKSLYQAKKDDVQFIVIGNIFDNKEFLNG